MKNPGLFPEELRKHIFPFLLSRNSKEAFSSCPSRPVEGTDLSLYAMLLSDSRAAAVGGQLCERLGLTGDEVLSLSLSNQLSAPYTLRPLSEMLGLGNDPENPVLILSNIPMIMGAGEMLNPQALLAASETLGQEFIILPSSRHEVLLLPKNDLGTGALRRLVSSVNRSVVAPEDRLSDSVYRYSARTGILSMVP